ncbi:MAG: hypothetical protein HY329_06960, partial [Chloroflexi bacterium]|nr:hypothetical protein [Chloroflexota bacterium]
MIDRPALRSIFVLALVSATVLALSACTGSGGSSAPSGGSAQPPAAQPPAKAPSQAAPSGQAAPAPQPAVSSGQAAAPTPLPTSAPAASKEKRRILYGSSAQGSSFYVHAVSVGRLWNAEVPEVGVTNVEAGGCADHFKRMEKGEFLAAPICPDEAYRAWHGLDEFKGRSGTVARYLYVYSLAPNAWAVRRDARVSQLEELDGKPWTAGTKGSGTEKQSIGIFEALGILPKLTSGGLQDLIQDVKDRRLIGLVKTQPGPRTIDAATQELLVSVPLDMLSFTPEQEQKVRDRFPYYTFMTLEKDQLTAGFPSRTVRTVTQTLGTAVHKDLPED